MFAAMGLSAVVPVLHGLVLYGWDAMTELIGLRWLIAHGLMYLTGAALYAVSIPLVQILWFFFRMSNLRSARSGHTNLL